MPIRTIKSIIVLSLLAFAFACGDDEDASNNANNVNNTNNTGGPLEVEGTWLTQFETTETITSEDWNGQDLVSYQNDDNVAITFAGPDDEFNPETYGKIVWTEIEDDTFYYCTVAFGLAALAEAENAEDDADRAALEGEGCGGFAWTRMTRQ